MNKSLKAVFTAVLVLWSFSASAQRHDRGYDMSNPVSFVGQGWWMIGGTADYSFHNMEDYSFAVVDRIDLLGYNLTVSPAFCYMLKDNFGIGARLEYSRNMAKIDTAKVSIAGVDLALDRYHTIDHSIKTKAILRNYIPIGDQKVFALVTETQLSFGLGQSKVACKQDGGINGTYAQSYSVGLNVCPGFVAFASEKLAVELSVNMLGLNLSHTKQIHNQIYTGEADATSLNFKINVLSLGFGLYYFL